MTSLRWLTTQTPDCDSHNPALLDSFLTSDASICSTMTLPPLGNSDHVVVSVSIDFPTNSQQDVPLHRIAYDYSCVDWDGLHDHLRDVPWEHIFKLGASATASEFCEWVQVGIDVYIPYRKYQVKPHSSPWFSAACAAAIVIEITFFLCTKVKNLLILRSSSDRIVFIAKGLFKLPNLHMLIKQKSPLLHRNLALVTSGKFLIVFSTKVNLLYLLYSMAQRSCLLHLIKQNCLLKIFL